MIELRENIQDLWAKLDDSIYDSVYTQIALPNVDRSVYDIYDAFSDIIYDVVQCVESKIL